MSTSQSTDMTRRELLKTSGQIAAVSALAGVAIPHVHASVYDTIQLALVGCGGRGTGAANNALSVSPQNGPTSLVAMADVFEPKLKTSYESIKKSHDQSVDVPDDRKFIGFDGYKHAMDCLKPGDIVLLTTPPAFRWPMFAYAIQKGLNVFMEKPTTVDGPSTRKMLALAEEADRRNIKVGVGLMCRHCVARHELHDRIKAGEIGDIMLMRAYRMHGPIGHAFPKPKPGGISELLYQIQEFHAFLWASGGCYSDFYIHNIDECCWMKDAWPVSAKALGGRHYRDADAIDQNFDSYSVEYTFADGTKLYLEGRCVTGAHTEFASYAHGSKCAATISTSGHSPARCRIFKGQNFINDEVVWKYGDKEPSPYQIEWDDLLEAIRENKPYNEAKRGAEASLVTAMGRMAAHTGQIVTYEQALNHTHEFAPDVDKLTMDSPAPLQVGPNGKYPVPQPGINREREY